MRCIARLLQAKYRMTTLELVGILKSCPSMLARINAPPKKKSSLPHMVPGKSRQTFLRDHAWLGCASLRLDRLLQRLWV